MRTLRLTLGVGLVVLAGCGVAAAGEKTLDLRRAAPADAYLVVYGKHNPERDFQRQYYQQVWKTIEDTKIVPRAVRIVTSRLSADQTEKAKAVLEEIKQAAAPIRFEALAHAEEVIYAQQLQVLSGQAKTVVTQHLVAIRLTPEGAAETQKGIKNLFGLVEKYSGGKVPVQSSTEADATIVTLAAPAQVPFRPTVVRVGDVLLASSSEQWARQSLAMLVRGAGTSKFDDPRLKEALSHLPPPEDGLVFFDARQLVAQMRGVGDFLRSVAGGNREAERVAGLLDVLFDEIAVLDYEVTVEYTEANLNRTAAYGKLMPGARQKTLGKVFGSGVPSADWGSWVPAKAISFSLGTGADLHPLYERVLSVIKERFPEAEPGLARFEELQSKIDVHLDRDIFQSFSGEHVSVSLPGGKSSAAGGRGSVFALRCRKPDRIRELLHRLVDKLKQIPALAGQRLQLVKCEDLDGFEQLSGVMLATLGVKPVVGFRDGWMMIGSSAEAVKAVLATRAGKAPTIADSETFKQFHLEVKGPVTSISYRNTAEEVHHIARVLNQVGGTAPMVFAMLGRRRSTRRRTI